MAEKIPPTFPGQDHCSACNAYWQLDDEHGYCLRYPPVVTMGTHVDQPGDNVPQAESLYPEVKAGWWCREFLKQLQF